MKTRVRVVALFVVMVLITSATGAVMAGPSDDAAARALAWLATQQNADGGFSDGFAPGSSIGATADAILAAASAGQDAGVWKKNGRSPLDFLQSRAGQMIKPGELGKTIMAVTAAGASPYNFGGIDLAARLNVLHKSGGYGGTLYEDTLAVLALASAGQSVPDDVIAHILAAQTEEGAWAFTGETTAGAGDTNTTALVVQALIATGHREAIGRALDYFRRAQNADAGWPYQTPSAYGTETDANSTANVIQALIAAGESLDNWSQGGQSDPFGALIRLQDSQTGAFNYQASAPGANVLATIQAIPALKRATFVRVPVARATVAAPPQTLPVAGGELVAWPVWLVIIGVVLLGAGLLTRRRV